MTVTIFQAQEDLLPVYRQWVIRITDGPRGACDSLNKPNTEKALENPSLLRAVGKLAVAGEQAGFSLEQMIELLNEGLSVVTLLDLISWRLEKVGSPIAPPAQPSCWLV
jgi:hypothetical protein